LTVRPRLRRYQSDADIYVTTSHIEGMKVSPQRRDELGRAARASFESRYTIFAVANALWSYMYPLLP